MLDSLAAAYAEAGRFAEAATAAQQAAQLAARNGNQPLAEEIHRRLESYRAGRPFRQASGK